MDLGSFASWIRLGSKITPDAKYAPVLLITNQADALTYLKLCVDHTLTCRPYLTHLQALAVERTKIAYFAGFHGLAMRRRVEVLYQAIHPYAGPVHDSHQSKPLQLAASFADLCTVWDVEKPGAFCFGAYPQPTWRPTLYA